MFRQLEGVVSFVSLKLVYHHLTGPSIVVLSMEGPGRMHEEGS